MSVSFAEVIASVVTAAAGRPLTFLSWTAGSLDSRTKTEPQVRVRLTDLVATLFRVHCCMASRGRRILWQTIA